MNGQMNAFVPAVEPNVGQEVFLSANPWEMLKSAKFAEVPLLVGINLEETAFMAPSNNYFIFKYQ